MIEIFKDLPWHRLRDYATSSLSHMTVKKGLNIARAEMNLALKRKQIGSMPYILVVDPTNLCHLRCALCATGQRKYLRPRGIMKFRTFKKIIDEIGDYLVDVHFVWWGEPFLNKEILKFVEYARKKNVGTFVSTNFSLPLDEVFMRQIVKSGLDTLNFSLDGITSEVYKKYRVGGNFDLVVKNIKTLSRIRREMKAKKPRLEWQFLINKYNEYQLPKLPGFARELGVDSVVTEQIIVIFGQSDREKYNLAKWLPKDKRYRPTELSLRLNKSDNMRLGKCWWLYRGVAISHDGGVSPCCYNNSKREDFGNILKQNFGKIWNNDKFLAARGWVAGENTSAKILCQRCNIPIR